MNLRRLEILQWTGLLFGALAFTAGHVVGYGLTEAQCGRGGVHWGISNSFWQGLLMTVAGALVLAAAGAAAAVVSQTRRVSYESPPPQGRIRFFAIAALAANVIFLMIVLLDALGTIFNVACRQS